MKLEKLKEIQAENNRFVSKLNEAIKAAETNTYQRLKEGKTYRDDDCYEVYNTNECTNSKQASAFKRSAMDMKRILANL